MDAEAAIRLQSETLSAEQISARVGASPTEIARKGEPVSPRNSDGPRHSATTWLYSVRADGDDPLTEAFQQLATVLRRLADIDRGDETRDVVLMLYGRDMGAWHVIEPQYIELMARAGAGLVLDLYNDCDE